MADAAPSDRLDLDAVRAWQRRVTRLAESGDAPWLADEIARRLAERLELIRLRPQVWVDASGLAGRGLALLRRAYPEAQGWVVEPDPQAAALLRAALRRPWWQTLGRRHESVNVGPDDPWPQGVGLVWSNLGLHWDADPPRTLARWHAGITPGGFVMFSTFGPDTLRELRPIYAERGWGPPGLAAVDMHDLGDMLVEAGFADPVMDQELLTLTWSDPDRMLADLRAWGVNAAPGRFPGLRTPRWRDRWREAVWSLAGPDGRVRLSVEVAYGHAFRVERSPRVAPTGSISVEALRATARVRRSGTSGG